MKKWCKVWGSWAIWAIFLWKFCEEWCFGSIWDMPAPTYRFTQISIVSQFPEHSWGFSLITRWPTSPSSTARRQIVVLRHVHYNGVNLRDFQNYFTNDLNEDITEYIENHFNKIKFETGWSQDGYHQILPRSSGFSLSYVKPITTVWINHWTIVWIFILKNTVAHIYNQNFWGVLYDVLNKKRT